MTVLSHVARLRDLAAQDPDRLMTRVVHPDGTTSSLTRASLLGRATQAAHLLRARGVTPASTVVVALPTCLDHVVTTYATWMLGACVLPASPALTPTELAALDRVVAPAHVVHAPLGDLTGLPLDPPPEVVPHPGRAMCSGGSTGTPKVIVSPGPHVRVPGDQPGLLGAVGLQDGDSQLVGGGLFHNTPFTWSHLALFEGQPVTYLERFDAALFVDAVERFRPTVLPMVPTMMQRVARLDGVAGLAPGGWPAVRRVLHTGGPCPAWVKRAWCELVGPETVLEAYGGTDYIGATTIRGDEWLARPGSVGRGVDCDIRVVDEHGTPVPPGVVGQVWMRLHDGAEPPFRYLGGAVMPTSADGYRTLGDLGSLDDDGYLYLADRRTDLIVSGGANVYPAEVEAVLSEHPAVLDAVVVGLPDEEWGRRVHAMVVLSAAAGPDELIAHCRRHLAPHKCPKTVEVVPALPRNEAGKIRRSALVPATPG